MRYVVTAIGHIRSWIEKPDDDANAISPAKYIFEMNMTIVYNILDMMFNVLDCLIFRIGLVKWDKR